MPLPGPGIGAEPDYSDELAREIDDEIRRLIDGAHERAHSLLTEHLDDLHRLSRVLIEQETIDKDEFERLLAGESPDTAFLPPPPADAEDGDEPESAKTRRPARPAPAAVPVARRARARAAAGAGAAGPLRPPRAVGPGSHPARWPDVHRL